jgi:hypothetical protein
MDLDETVRLSAAGKDERDPTPKHTPGLKVAGIRAASAKSSKSRLKRELKNGKKDLNR